MKRTIFPYDFEPYYPVGIQPCQMYVDVANRIYNDLKDTTLDLPDADKLKKEIAINVAIYYEDKMSDIGLWNAFVSCHTLMYFRALPIFDDYDELDKKDVNLKEVELLIWMVISRNFDDRFLNPLAMGEETAEAIMEILTEDDEVEVNESLHDYIYNKEKANDYFKLKHILIWLRRSYLLCSPLSENRFSDLCDTYEERFNKSEAVYYADTTFSMTTEIGPMALLPHQWLAEMYFNHGMRDEADKLHSLQYCQQDCFLVKEADAEWATLTDTRGEERKLKNVYPDLFCTGFYVFTSLVKYGEEDWEINGLIFNSDEKVYKKMRERKLQLEKSYKRAYPLYMERTKGKRIAFFKSKRDLKKWLSKIAPEVDLNAIEHELPSGSQVAFISKKARIIFASNIIHAIKCKDNPYYKKCNKSTLQTETIDTLLNTEEIHPELLLYLLENKMLVDGDLSGMMPCEIGNDIFTTNIDFIARNHRRHFYHDHDY